MKKKIQKFDILSFFKKLSDKERNVCLLYGATNDGWKKFIGFNPVDHYVFKNKKTFRGNIFPLISLRRFIKKCHKYHRIIICCFSYDLGLKIHNITQKAKDDINLPDVYFLAFEDYISFEKNSFYLNYQNKKYPKIIEKISNRKIKNTNKKFISTNFKPELSKNKYYNAINKIKKYIIDGDIYQVNFSYRMKGKTNIPARELFLRMLKKNPVDFAAYIEGENFELLSASPERFLEYNNRTLTTCPIKGTRPRGINKKDDEKMKKELLENVKETAELNMITDLLRNDMGEICDIGSVKVVGKRLIKKCPTVWHTYSKITGKMPKITYKMMNMLPGGSISGCPKKRSLEIIDELEPTVRSFYTGVIGYVNPDLKELDFNIAIRTIIKKNDKLYLQVGGGIVYDSITEKEYEETKYKAASFMKIL